MAYVFCYGGMGAFPPIALNCDKAIPATWLLVLDSVLEV